MPDTSELTHPPFIVLYDGTCGLCDRAVQFILQRDPARKFRFAALQSDIGRGLMTQNGFDPDQIDTIILIEGAKVFTKSSAVLRIAMELRDPWPLVGALIFVPAELRDSAYDYIARHRKIWFKSRDACATPTPEQREQFLTSSPADDSATDQASPAAP